MKNHILHYMVLIIALVTTFGLMFVYKGQTNAQLYISGFGCTFYALWGILHHRIEGRLNTLIALEYVLISFIAFAMLLLVLSY